MVAAVAWAAWAAAPVIGGRCQGSCRHRTEHKLHHFQVDRDGGGGRVGGLGGGRAQRTNSATSKCIPSAAMQSTVQVDRDGGGGCVGGLGGGALHRRQRAAGAACARRISAAAAVHLPGLAGARAVAGCGNPAGRRHPRCPVQLRGREALQKPRIQDSAPRRPPAAASRGRRHGACWENLGKWQHWRLWSRHRGRQVLGTTLASP